MSYICGETSVAAVHLLEREGNLGDVHGIFGKLVPALAVSLGLERVLLAHA